VKCIYSMRMHNLFSLHVPFMTIYHQIYKWNARNFNVSFLTYDVMIQYDRGDQSALRKLLFSLRNIKFLKAIFKNKL